VGLDVFLGLPARSEKEFEPARPFARRAKLAAPQEVPFRQDADETLVRASGNPLTRSPSMILAASAIDADGSMTRTGEVMISETRMSGHSMAATCRGAILTPQAGGRHVFDQVAAPPPAWNDKDRFPANPHGVTLTVHGHRSQRLWH